MHDVEEGRAFAVLATIEVSVLQIYDSPVADLLEVNA
jgi:hypothetical protein